MTHYLDHVCNETCELLLILYWAEILEEVDMEFNYFPCEMKDTSILSFSSGQTLVSHFLGFVV